MNKKTIALVLIPIIVIFVIIAAIVILPVEKKGNGDDDEDENGGIYVPAGAKKAIVLCSANDFYDSGSESKFNSSNDSNFTLSMGNWNFESASDEIPNFDPSPGQDGTPGFIYAVIATGTPPRSGNLNFTYNWNKYYSLENYACYNMSAYIKSDCDAISGAGARIGLRWQNSTGDVVRIDWSKNITTLTPIWTKVSVAGFCNNETGKEITNLTLILSFNGTCSGGDIIRFDDVDMRKWISVNITIPVQPPPPPPPPNLKVNSDGFPAQALQVYWVLMSHGYTNDSIFLILYHTGDNVIDINRNDGIANDLDYAGVDVENDDVNATRFKQELNATISGSFASNLIEQDQLIIYMVDHGSNRILGDGNATFHFEADNSYITELEFFNLVKNIKCKRILINVDCCFSGNFLNQNNNIGQSWYNLPNCILVSAASNVFSWYWINNFNGDNFAGSWFFHPFWDQLNKSQTILSAYNFACLFSPAIVPPTRVIQIQSPLMKDYLGIANSWTL